MGGVCPSTPEQKPTPKLPIGDLRMCVAFVVNLIVSLESFFFRRPGVLYDMCGFNNPNAIACFGSAVLSTTGGCTKRSLFFFFFTFISPHFGTAFNSYRIFFCFVGVVLAPLAPPEAKPISLSFASFGFISPVFDAVY